ncbi:MAG: 4-(cytidine 5'-diphospho)-2-C-methyl-D-erythritol kinase [Planctomycetaceae bacterium]|nr:4-(cytidine 5'-diphospho)-2-C-methyl-D-erythritol kinase [Planctomycetaceae bacterium]
MIYTNDGKCWVAQAPAKINLFFEVFGKRPDGYHDVCSVCAPIELYDTLSMSSRNDNEIRLNCRFPDTSDDEMSDVPQDQANIVVRAVELIRKKYGIKQGCEIRLIKRIPSRAGMGGGSSNAATAIMLAGQLWDLHLTPAEMMILGAELGSDVPLFFIDGMSIGDGRGEQVKPVSACVTLDVVVVKPAEGISTAEAFRLSVLPEKEQRKSPDRLLQGLAAGNLSEIGNGLFNRLEAVSETLCPMIRTINNAFVKLDCVACQMTGSGTACFAICRHSKHAQYVSEQIRTMSLGKVFYLKTLKVNGEK